MTNTNRKHSAKKKLISAIAMLTVSAVTLSTATYAWFTMNKEVSVTGMEVKAHAEEGLLINEVSDARSNYWDDLATGGWSSENAIQLRPASTSNLTSWWHANSKKSYSEAGASGTVIDIDNTVDLNGSGAYYKDISSGAIGSSGTQAASEGTKAETIVYYDDASFGTNGKYDNGEGYYVLYKYYLKSSKTGDGTYDVKANNFMVKVTATKQNTDNSGATNNMALDKALRVGVKIQGQFKIFAPLWDSNQTYNVADSASTINGTAVTAYTSETAIGDSSATIAIPNVTTDGTEVDVYVWFEGEDPNCKSDNLTAVLDTYLIDINFRDNGLATY